MRSRLPASARAAAFGLIACIISAGAILGAAAASPTHAAPAPDLRSRPASLPRRLVVFATALALICGLLPTLLAPSPALGAIRCTTSGPGGYSIEVCLIAPDDGATLSGDQAVQATFRVVSGSAPSRRGLQFFVDGQKVLHDYFAAPGSSPARYEYVLQTARWVDGARQLQVAAAMTDGFTSTRAGAVVTFANGVTEPPVNNRTFTPATGTTPPSGQPFVLAAVGDGSDGGTNTANVANLIDGWDPNMFLYLGDVYEEGTPTEFHNYYAPTFGRFRAISNPTIGNHEWPAGNGAGYFDYWDNVPHYFSVDAAGWHIVSINMIREFDQYGAGSPQYNWLAQDLETSSAACTLVISHIPAIRYHTDPDPINSRWEDFWALLAQHGVEAVLSGDNHNYQRWKPLDGTFAVDPAGVTQFVVGTGGRPFNTFSFTDPRFETGFDNSAGALRMELNPQGAAFQFVSTAGATLDSGSIACENITPDTIPPTAPSNLTATSPSAARVDLAWTAATDNVAVTAYDVYRDGSLLASLGNQTAFADTTVSPSTTYSYTVRARDAEGNTSPDSPAATVTTQAADSILTFAATDDTYVQASSPTATAGNATTIQVDNSPVKDILLKFNVSGLAGRQVTAARLRLYNTDPSPTGGVFFETASSSWSEGTATWNNAPATTGSAVASLGSVSAGTWYEVDLSSVVTGDGVVSLRVTSPSTNGANYTSSEGTASFRPQLVVSYRTSGDTTKPSAPSGLAATSPSAGRIDLTWNASSDNVGVTAYEVYRDGGPAPLASVGGTETTYADTSVEAGTTHSYVVRARDAASNVSDPSNTATGTSRPAAPGSLAAVGHDGQVALTWTAPNGATSYSVKRSTTSGGPYTVISPPGVTDTTYTDSSVVNGTTYHYVVSALNAGGESGDSAQASATPSPPPSAAPGNVTAVPGDRQVLLSWDAVASASSYIVRRGTASGGPYSVIQGGVVGTTYTDSSVSNGTTYYYVVRAANGAGEGPDSAEVSATPQVPPPAAPTSLVAVGLDGQASLTWSASAGAISYNVKRSTASGGPYATISAPGAVTGTSFLDSAAPNNIAYYYVVTAVNAGGESSTSNEALLGARLVFLPTDDTHIQSASPTATAGSATTLVVDKKPIIHMLLKFDVTGLAGRQVTDARLRLYNTDPSPQGGDYFRTASSSWSEATTNWNNAPATSGSAFASLGPVAANSWYQVNLAAVVTGDGIVSTRVSTTSNDSAGFASSENTATLRPQLIVSYTGPSDATSPTAPGDLAAVSPSAGRIDLSWTPSTDNVGVTAYDVYRDGGGTHLASVGGDATAYSDTAVAAGTTHTYVVRARDAAGNVSDPSNTASGTSRPAAPVDLQATAGDAQVELSWSGSTGAVSYNVKRSTSSGGPYTTISAPGTVTGLTYTDRSVANGTTYHYVVTAVNGGGESVGSNQATATPVAPPVAPTNLTAGAGDGRVDLAWDAVSGATSYNVKRSTTTGGPYTLLRAGLSGTSHSDTTAANGTTYYYVVTAVNAAGESVPSNEASATPQVAPPATPTGLQASAGDSEVRLTWAASSGASNYNVKRSVTSGGPYTTISTPGGVTATSFTDSTVSNGTTYYYVVTAVNAAGESDPSNEASATPLPPPATPTNVTARAGDGSVLITWDSAAGAASYAVKRGTSPGTHTALADGITATSYTDETATNGSTYYYVVSATNAAGSSADSTEVSVTLAPAAPTNLTATPGDQRVTLDWEASAGATSYRVYRAPTSAGPFVQIASGVSETTYLDDDPLLLNGTTYYYVVRAVNAGGESGDSNQASAQPTPLPDPPAAPADLQATPGDSVVSLSWTGSTGADGYNVYRGTTSGSYGATPLNGETLVTTQSYADSGVSNGTTYYYVVRAVNTGGESASSNEASATPRPDAPPAPTGLSAVGGNSQVTLAWNSSAGADSYNVKRSTTSGGPYTTISAAGTVTGATYTDTTATNGTTYHYVVTAVNAGGESPNSNQASATPTARTFVFSDGFESGNLSNWTSSGGLTVQNTRTHTGSWAARGNTTNGNTYAKKSLSSTASTGYLRTYFYLASGYAHQVNVLRYRTAADGSLGYLFVNTAGRLSLRNDAGAVTTTSVTSVSSDAWHALELRLTVNGTSSSTEVWLDGVRVNDLSLTGQNWGTTPIGRIQIGEVQSARTYDVTFDDVAFDTARIGLAP